MEDRSSTSRGNKALDTSGRRGHQGLWTMCCAHLPLKPVDYALDEIGCWTNWLLFWSNRASHVLKVYNSCFIHMMYHPEIQESSVDNGAIDSYKKQDFCKQPNPKCSEIVTSGMVYIPHVEDFQVGSMTFCPAAVLKSHNPEWLSNICEGFWTVNYNVNSKHYHWIQSGSFWFFLTFFLTGAPNIASAAQGTPLKAEQGEGWKVCIGRGELAKIL